VTERQAPGAFQDVQLPAGRRPEWLEDLRALLAEVAVPHQGPIEAERLRALREMSGELAHDLSNILTGILGRIQLLVPTVSDADLRRQLRMIEQVASGAAWIVQCLHEFGRIRLTRPLEQVDVNRLVDEMALLARTSWGERMSLAGKRGDVTVEAAPVPAIRGDAVELRKALSSVVLGALEAMPDGGELAFRTGVDGNAVVCVVAHSGLRLEEEDRVRAFEPVFGTRREKRKWPDLSAAYAAVRRHGGNLTVLSEGERGAAFTIRLPVDGPPAECVLEPEPKSASPVEAGTPGAARILVIDDSAEVCDLLGDLLRRHGYIVVTAEDGESGLVEAGAQTFGLAMVDIGLPGISGVEVATRIKCRWPKTTVVLMTGYTDRIGGKEAKEKGIDAVLTKPFVLDQVESLAERALARGNESAVKKPNPVPPSLATEIREEPPIVELP